MKFNVVTICYQKDKHSFLEIREVQLRHLVLESLGDTAFGALNVVSFGWLYEVRWGPKDKNFGIADRSVGHLLFELGQWCADGFGTYRKRRDIAEIPVSYEWVREHMPEAGWPFNGLDDDQENLPG